MLLSWQCCPVCSVLIKGSWVVKRSQLSESPPPHCLKSQHAEFKFNFFWTHFFGEVQFDFCSGFNFPSSVFVATVEFRSSMDSGVCSQEPSLKSTLALPTKKSVTYPGDFQDNPAKPPLYHKQPPALPPKPFSRIPNHTAGQWRHFSSSLLFICCFPPLCQTVIPCFMLHTSDRQIKWVLSPSFNRLATYHVFLCCLL